ncbi:MAG: hypothetical protein ACAI44_11315 [Candidatus Sericytochromatia bacterium]
MKLLLILLIGLFCWIPCSGALALGSAALASEPELILLPAAELTGTADTLLTADGRLALADREEQDLHADRSDLWTNVTYALGGSAIGNALVALVIFLNNTISADALAKNTANAANTDWLNAAGPATLGLLILPMLVTPLMMHLTSPAAENGLAAWSIGGTILATALHLLLMLPFYLIFNQGDLSGTYIAILPAAFISAVLLEALGAAGGHELGQNLRLASTQQGLLLSYRWEF